MSSKAPSPIRKAWYKWKALRLPWRKRFLVGLDLQGNTFWEFRDTLNSHTHRMRRIVQYPPATHFSEVNISPQWHQWLRHTRSEAPSITEQSEDVVRQHNLKVLAAQADARWAAKPSFLDKPAVERIPAFTQMDSAGGDVRSTARIEVDLGAGVGVGEGGEGLKDAETPLKEAARDKEAKIEAPDREKNYHPKPPEEARISEKKYKEDPWKQARGAPSEEWQPQAWSPSVAPTKR